MSTVLGLLLGAGVLLVLSPWLWPAGAPRGTARPNGSASRLERLVADRLAQAGLVRFSPAVFVVLSGLVGIAAGAVGLVLSPVPVLALAAALLAAALPWLLVSARARRRRAAARAAWPDLVDHLVASLRAGSSLGEAIAALAEVGPPETREAFAALGREVRTRGTLGPSLDALKERLADPVADRLIETLRLAREVGGTELPALLRGLASSLRLESAVRAEALARQSWVVAAARLGVAAPWIVLVVLSSQASAAEAYNSAAGSILLLVGGAVTVVAYRLMVAVGRLPEERRWFA